MKQLATDAVGAVIIYRKSSTLLPMRFVLWVLAATAGSPGFAQSPTDLPSYFVVQRTSDKGTDVRSFHCAAPVNGRTTCDESEVSVTYYDWSTTTAGGRELQRCQITAGNLAGQTYESTSPGNWHRIDSGGMCGAVIATSISVEGNDRATL